jgi:hypothetical protein
MLLLLNAHAFHPLLNALSRLSGTTSFKLAQGNAAILVFGGHLLPFLHLRNTGTLDGISWVLNCLVACHISDFDE